MKHALNACALAACAFLTLFAAVGCYTESLWRAVKAGLITVTFVAGGAFFGAAGMLIGGMLGGTLGYFTIESVSTSNGELYTHEQIQSNAQMQHDTEARDAVGRGSSTPTPWIIPGHPEKIPPGFNPDPAPVGFLDTLFDAIGRFLWHVVIGALVVAAAWWFRFTTRGRAMASVLWSRLLRVLPKRFRRSPPSPTSSPGEPPVPRGPYGG